MYHINTESRWVTSSFLRVSNLFAMKGCLWCPVQNKSCAAATDEIISTMLSNQLAEAKAKARQRDLQTEDYIATPYIKKNTKQNKKPDLITSYKRDPAFVQLICDGNQLGEPKGATVSFWHKGPHCYWNKGLRGKVWSPHNLPFLYTPGQNTHNNEADLFMPGSRGQSCLWLASQETPSYMSSVM